MMDPEAEYKARREYEEKQHGKIRYADGMFGNIAFSLTGPRDQIDAIVRFMKQLVKMSGDK